MGVIANEVHAFSVPVIGQMPPLYGRGGAIWIKQRNARTARLPNAGITQTVGACSAQRGGLLYGLTSGWNWEDSCRLGNVMGAIKIASRGPQNHAPTRGEIDAVLHATYGIHLPA